MKYIGENAIKKLISLIKSDIKKKLDKNQGTANSGKILGVDATGEVAPTDTEVATLVDVPNGIVKGDGSTLSAAVAGTDYAAPSIARKVKLTVAGWNSSTKTQSVTISGVSANEANQLLLPMPTTASKSAYDEAGIQMTGQAANSVTFTCDTVPTAAIEVWVVIQSVKDVTPPQ